MIYENEAIEKSRYQKRRLNGRTKIGDKNNTLITKDKSHFIIARRTILLVKDN
jgi:hypothetical protein